jgi:hypothetical protein
VTINEELTALGEDAGFGHLAYQGAIESAVLNLLRNPEAVRAARRRQRMLEASARRAGAGKGTSKTSASRSPKKSAAAGKRNGSRPNGPGAGSRRRQKAA